MTPNATPSAWVASPALAGSIVVGHDGSGKAQNALTSALELAEALSAPLLIVRVWSIETAPHGSVFHDGYATSFAEINSAVLEALSSDVAAPLSERPGVPVTMRGVLGKPADTLISISTDARMLVVGSRGLGGFAGLLLGAVSEQCVRHAACPVLVVRNDR